MPKNEEPSFEMSAERIKEIDALVESLATTSEMAPEDIWGDIHTYGTNEDLAEKNDLFLEELAENLELPLSDVQSYAAAKIVQINSEDSE